jgi:predicted lactoylglutathione lyase
MPIKMFVNLPVADVTASIRFFTALGFAINPQFTNENAASVVISEENYAMLLSHDFFRQFTSLPLADARRETGGLVALGLESRAAVDAMMDKALAAGGREARPAQDHGFMYGRAFTDLDGHIWEPFWMDPSYVQPQTGA